MTFIAIFRDTFRQVMAQVIMYVMLAFALFGLFIATVMHLPDYETYRESIAWEQKNYERYQEQMQEEYADETDGVSVKMYHSDFSVQSREEWTKETIAEMSMGFTWITFLLFSVMFVFAAAFLVTGKLKKGVIEQYLSKPVSRITIVLGRSAAIFTAFMIPSIINVVGTHGILDLRFGYSYVTFLEPLGFVAATGFAITGLCVGLGNLTRGPVLSVLVFSILLFVSFLGVLLIDEATNQPAASANPYKIERARHGDGLKADDIDDGFLRLLYRLILLLRKYVFIPALDFMIMSNSIGHPDGVVLTWRPLWVGLAQGAIGLSVGTLCFVRRDF